MSDMKKWIKLVESSENRIVDAPKKTGHLAKNVTVQVSPKAGGGVGRFDSYDGADGSANIDIKGIIRKLSAEDFSTPARDYEEPYVKGNDWFHVSQEPDTVGTLKDKPEFRPGDMVKIADVYGAVIGPGYGIFVAYGTTGQDCILSFDNKEIIVPVANIAAVLEQNAKDNFDEMDNDGNLSPMSFGSQNVKIEEPGMEQKDDFSKWMSTVEEALRAEGKEELEENIWSEEVANECGCAKWDCPTCFPDQDVHPGEHVPPQTSQGGEGPPEVIVIAAEPSQGLDQPAVCPHCGFPHGGDEDHGYDEEFPIEEKPDPGPYGRRDGQDSPMTFGNQNQLAQEDQFNDLGSPEWTYDERGENSPLTYGECNLEMQESEEQAEWEEAEKLIGEIMYMHDMGLSQMDFPVSREELETLPVEKIREIHSQVTGKPLVGMDEELQDEEMLVPPSQAGQDDLAGGMGGGLGGGGGMGGGGGGKFPPGTAPTMPESTQRGNRIMENVDKDVAAMLQSLKKYDKLLESRGPVLGLKTLTMEKAKPDFPDVDKDDDKDESISKAEKDKKSKKPWEKDEVDEAAKAGKTGKAKMEEELDEAAWDDWQNRSVGDRRAVYSDIIDRNEARRKQEQREKEKKERNSEPKQDEKKPVDESADAEVLNWMKRFSKLGNMKGYGR